LTNGVSDKRAWRFERDVPFYSHFATTTAS
jgi:hypothetical protein